MKQTTVIICSSETFESYTTTSQFKNAIIYSTCDSIPPFSICKHTVHYENSEPFLTLMNMERVIKVSHWGSIAVEETIELVHSSAKQKGPF